MNPTLKTALIIGGTALATTVVIDLATGGAVRALVSEKVGALTSGAAAPAAAPAPEAVPAA